MEPSMTAVALAKAPADDATSALLRPSCPAPAMPLDQFVAAVHAAKPGGQVEYFRGALPFDRRTGHLEAFAADRPTPGFTAEGRAAIRAELAIRSEIGIVASAAWDLYERGMVLLAQRRHGDQDYAYLAIKRRAAR